MIMSLFKPSVISISAAYEELFKKSPVPTMFAQHVGSSNSVLAAPLNNANMHNHHVSTQARNSKMSIIQRLRDNELDSQTDDSSFESPDEFCIISPQKLVATRVKLSTDKRLFSHSDRQTHDRATNRDDFKVPPTFQRPRASTNKFISNERVVDASRADSTSADERIYSQLKVINLLKSCDTFNKHTLTGTISEPKHSDLSVDLNNAVGGTFKDGPMRSPEHSRIPFHDYSEDTSQKSHSLSSTASDSLKECSKHISENSCLAGQDCTEIMDQEFHSLSSTADESDNDECKVTPVARKPMMRKRQSKKVTSSLEILNLPHHNSVTRKIKSLTRQRLQSKHVSAIDTCLSDSDRRDDSKNLAESNNREVRNTHRSSQPAVTREPCVSKTDDVSEDLKLDADVRSALQTTSRKLSDRGMSKAVSPDSSILVDVRVPVAERSNSTGQASPNNQAKFDSDDQDKLICVNEMNATEKAISEDKNNNGSGMDSADEDNAAAAVKPIQSTKSPAHHSPSIHCLSNWIIKPQNNLKSIVVDGKRSMDPDDCYWHSSAIVERIGARTVKTCSGTVYKLDGKMDVDYAYNAGFPEKIIMAFKSGFPPNWKKLVHKHFVDGAQIKSRNKKEKKHKKTPASKSKPVPKVNVVQSSVSLLDSSGNRDMSIPVSNLHQTRTGRVVKPPVLWWCGEQVKLNDVTGMVEIMGCSPYMNTNLCPVPSDPRKSNNRFSGCGASFMETPKSNRSVDAAKSRIPSKKTSVLTKKPKNILPSLRKSDVLSEKCTPVNKSTFKKQISSQKTENLSLLGSTSKSSKGHQKSSNKKRNKENQSIDKVLVSGSGDVSASEVLTTGKKHAVNTGCAGELDKNQTLNVVKPSQSTQKLAQQQRRLSRSPYIQICNRCCQAVHDCRRTGCINVCQNGNVRQRRKAAVQSRQLSKSLLTSNDTNMQTSTDGELSCDMYIASCDRAKQTKRKAACKSSKTESSNRINESKKSQRHTRSQNHVAAKNNDADTDAEWSQKEKDCFNKAMEKTSSESPMFWSLIAQAVGTRTLEECQQYHYKDALSDGSKKIKQAADKKNKRPVVLTGAVGTLKRKRALRQLMDQFNEGCEDDMFDSTPMRAVKTRSRIGGLMADIDDREMFVLPFDTPTMATPHVGMRAMADPFSAKKTPSLSLPSPAIPDSIDRNKVEQFVHNMKRRGGKKRRMDKSDDQQKAVTKPACSNQRLLSTISEADLWQEEQNSNDKDSEEESDFYWSDDLGD